MTILPLESERGRSLVRPRRAVVLERWVSFVCVLGACLFVFWRLRPDLIFSDTTPSGGDMGAHVWGPAFLREQLLPSGRLSGWSADWYGGFPAFRFYMVLPALVIALLSYIIPYGVAFKLVSVAGLVALPLAMALFVRLAGLRFPAAPLAAVMTLPFLFDWSFSIWGGNISSTLAGEFNYSISLSLAVVYLGVLLRGIRSGKHRVLAGVLLALVGLSHLIPAIFAVVATVLAFLMSPQRKSLRWVVVVALLGATIPAFWLLPFWMQRKYYFNIDWVNVTRYWDYLVRPDWNALFVLAIAALLIGIMRKARLVFFLSALAAICAAGYRWLPQNSLWNSRLIPFYYICLYLLAALGLTFLLRGVIYKMRLSTSPPGPQPGGDLSFLENLALRFSRKVLVRIALLLPTLSLAVVLDAVLPTAVFKATIRGVMNVEDAEAARLADQVAHLAILVLFAALLIALVELVSVVRERGLPRWQPVLIDSQGFGSRLQPNLGEARMSSGRGRSIRAAWGKFHWVAMPVSVMFVSMLVIGVVAYPLRALGFAGHTDSKGNYGLHLAPDWVLTMGDWIPLGRPLSATGQSQDAHPGAECEGARRYRDANNRTRDTFSNQECARSDFSHVPSWVAWNFSGYEQKEPRAVAMDQIPGETMRSAGYEEYYNVVNAVGRLGEERGCGRVLWEYQKERLDSYGTPMSLMLLPHWTSRCMGSMEGLFFEGTLSVPFHFVNQDELSRFPSRAARVANYTGTNLDRGVQHMQLYGVRYYMALSEALIAAARSHPDLTEIAVEEPWVVFEVADSALVEPFLAEPVVVESSGDSAENWLDVALPFYYSYQRPSSGLVSVFPADDGPQTWERVEQVGVDSDGQEMQPLSERLPPLPLKPLPLVQVSNIEASNDSISFSVNQTGFPVLVKTSYFPNWRTDDALGPYRVAPNLMAVIPQKTDVELSYSWTTLDVLSYTFSGLGILLAFVLWRAPGFWPSEQRRDFR